MTSRFLTAVKFQIVVNEEQACRLEEALRDLIGVLEESDQSETAALVQKLQSSMQYTREEVRS